MLLGVTLGLLATASSASAQRTGSWIGALGGGASIPVGNFGDAAKVGWQGTAMVGYKPAESKMEWLLDASYHHNVSKAFSDAHDNLFVALGRVNYWTTPNLYILAGAGMMRDEFSSTTLGITTKNSTSAFALGGGLGFAMGKSLFVEGKFLNGFTKGQSTTLIPLTVGIRF
jgi:hypothetical protein